VGTEGRSQWRQVDRGPAFDAADRFVATLRQPDLPSKLPEIQSMVTPESWPAWRSAVLNGSFTASYLNELHMMSNLVRLPSDDMAYVFFPVVHPDQTEPILLEPGTRPMYMHVATLVQVGDRWLVHQLGPMVPPADLGRVPYSW
jgi:hypothetical protein